MVRVEEKSLFTEYLNRYLEEQAKKLYTEEVDHFLQKGDSESLFEKVTAYQDMLKESTETRLEEILQKEIPLHSFVGFPKWTIPQIHRPLPRSDDTHSNGVQQVGKHFLSLPALKKQYIDKALLSLYENVAIQGGSKVVLFTWVMTDGLGDYFAQVETAKILQERYPTLSIELVTLLHKKMSCKSPSFPSYTIYYTTEKDLHFSHFPDEFFSHLCSADLILQIPTQYLYWEELLETIKAKKQRLPRWETVGEYGFIDSKWYHPGTHARCMGLHFLEKGIFIKKMPSQEEALLLENHTLLSKIFPVDRLERDALQEYRKVHRFYLAYLITKEGFALYMHALMKYLEKDDKDIDLCLNSIGFFISALREGASLFHKYSIKEIEIHDESQVFVIPIAETGKKIRFFLFANISSSDFQKLLVLSEDFVGCRGDQSFTEAVSAEKVFFYDSPKHARAFLKDLLALGRNRISSHKSAVEFLSLFIDPPSGGFGLPLTIEEVGERIGELLQDPDTQVGIKQLSQILKEEYSVNQFLQHLVARALFFTKHPEGEKIEEFYLQEFIDGKKDLPQLAEAVSSLLTKQ